MGAEFLMGSSKTRSRTDQPVSFALEVCVCVYVNVKYSGQIIHKTYSKLASRFRWGSQLEMLPTNSRFWHTESSYAVILWIRKRITVSWQASDQRSGTSQTPRQVKRTRAKAMIDKQTHLSELYSRKHIFRYICATFCVLYFTHSNTS